MRVLILLSCVVGSVLLSGCVGVPRTVPYARPYPFDLSQEEVLDIQVFLEPRHISFTNTTANAFGPSTIWLNERFGYPIESLAVGESKRIRLTSIRDEHSEFFQPGGFFATKQPERLVLAQLETTEADPLGQDRQVLFGMVAITREKD